MNQKIGKGIMDTKSIALTISALVLSSGANSAPITLDGMGMTSQWIDYESTSGEMSLTPWGNSDTLDANRVGIFVEFENGITGSASYSGVSGYWNQCCSVGGVYTGILADTTSGFFSDSANAAAGLHGLNNTGSGLPMAWDGLSMAFSGNFDLDYYEYSGSNFRASTTGWNSVEITLYSSTAPVSAVPVPAAVWLFGSGLLGLVGMARRKKA